MEYFDCVLHQDILFIIIETFYSAVIFVVAHSAITLGIYLVAVGVSVSCVPVGIYRAVVYSESKVSGFKTSELLLSVGNIRCSTPVVRMG